jgi:hypothetical protein
MPTPPENKDQRYWPAGGRRVTESLTDAGFAFVSEHSRLLDFVVFSQEGKLERVNPLIEFLEAEKELADTPEVKARLQECRAGLEKIAGFNDLMDEVVLTKTVDNFLTYISDLLATIYKNNPAMLRSAEQERLDFILQHPTMDELLSAIAERKVERLAYRGLKDLDGYVHSQMSFRLFPVEVELNEAAIIVERRNLLAHNRGIVSGLSVRRFPELAAFKGQRIRMTYKDIREMRKFLENAVFDIDARAISKFGLPARKLRSPPEELIGD